MEWLRALVRPTVTWAMTFIFGYGLLKGQIPWEAAVPIVTMVWVFWFQEKAIERAIEKVLGKREESGALKLMDYLIRIEKAKKGG